ncbi:DUF2628 domain-containing protein [Orrella dioscoreae]|uniref:DUF2628 domain-containing protein n=1 Tax=Orrella dioscoreae TaxID=1851544 RepID=UPI0012FFE984|nr:DUF2628 domain-containing protein [Orrella dioscoreae]
MSRPSNAPVAALPRQAAPAAGRVRYRLPGTQRYEDVKQGFSWPALCFGLAWMAVKGVWRPFVVYLCLLFGMGLAIEACLASASLWLAPLARLAAGVAGFVMAIAAGWLGNRWRVAALRRAGFVAETTPGPDLDGDTH